LIKNFQISEKHQTAIFHTLLNKDYYYYAFVMNTKAEIQQAIEDYQFGKNGFEKAHKWQSIEGNK